MEKSSRSGLSRTVTVFLISFGVCVALGVVLAYAAPVSAAPTLPSAHAANGLAATQPLTGTNATGPQKCVECHEDIVSEWTGTRHAAAFSSPIFQQAWTTDPNKNACLQCHTTGYQAADGTYTDEGV
jgi:hypothetical protein